MMPDARRRLNALANEAVCAPSSKANTQTARSANKDQDQTLARALMWLVADTSLRSSLTEPHRG
jgi:hypothetical protein